MIHTSKFQTPRERGERPQLESFSKSDIENRRLGNALCGAFQPGCTQLDTGAQGESRAWLVKVLCRVAQNQFGGSQVRCPFCECIQSPSSPRPPKLQRAFQEGSCCCHFPNLIAANLQDNSYSLIHKHVVLHLFFFS